MEVKNLKIEVPEGYEIDKAHSTFDNIVCVPIVTCYNDIAKQLFFNKKAYFIDSDGCVSCDDTVTDSFKDGNNAGSEEQVNWLIALNKLKNTAVYFNDGWVPNWEDDDEIKWFIILTSEDKFVIECEYTLRYGVVFFKTEQLAKKAIKVLGDETVKTALGVYVKN